MKTVLITNSDVIPTFNAITSIGGIPGIVSLKIAEAVSALREPARRVQDANLELVREYAEKDDSGEPIPLNQQNEQLGYLLDKTRRKEFREKVKELMEARTEVKLPLLTREELNELAKKKEIDPNLGQWLLLIVELPAMKEPETED